MKTALSCYICKAIRLCLKLGLLERAVYLKPGCLIYTEDFVARWFRCSLSIVHGWVIKDQNTLIGQSRKNSNNAVECI